MALRPKIFLVGLAGVLALQGLMTLLPTFSIAANLAVLGAVRLAQAAWILGVAWRLSPGPFPFGLARDQWFWGLRRGALWCLVFAGLAGLGGLALHLAGQDLFRMLHSSLPPSRIGLAAFFFVGTIIAPVTEELFFRGLVYGLFRRWGIIVALLASTLCFVLPHMIGSRIPVTQIVGGLVFALAYEKEKNLLVPIMIHAAGNFALFSISWLGWP